MRKKGLLRLQKRKQFPACLYWAQGSGLVQFGQFAVKAVNAEQLVDGANFIKSGIDGFMGSIAVGMMHGDGNQRAKLRLEARYWGGGFNRRRLAADQQPQVQDATPNAKCGARA